MNDDEFSKVGLYDHNAKSYRKVRSAYESGEKVVGIVHATGTGKTYNALQLALDNKDKKIIYVVPTESVAEHVESIIRDNPNLDRDVDFKNVEFRTYQSFVNMSREELSEIDCDLLILDEFHHIGAPVWGARINTIVETHPDMMVFGMTAYTVRDRGTPYERDMANPDTNELFSGKIVSRYDLVDAMLDGVLPRDVIYKTAYINLMGLEEELEKKVKNMEVTKEELGEYKKVLDAVKKRVAEAPGIAEVVRKYVKPDGKYIYFCPPKSEDGTNDINTIMKEAYEWFSQFVPPEDIEFYVTTSDMGDAGKHNRDMFYNDLTLDGKSADGKLRIMFAINQYNEGVHAPNIDGVIMGRGTKSDIIFFEQLGRALSVRGNVLEKYKEYETYTYDELVSLAKDKEIVVKDDMTKEDIIEKLVAPVIIDLSNNIEFIKELEDRLKDRVRERREKGIGNNENVSKLRDVSFDIDIVNEDLYNVLSKLRNRIYKNWDSMYELAKIYYDHHGNLNIKRSFKTTNGYEYDENGVNLGAWINTQRYLFKRGKLSQERIDKLNEIGMVFRVYKNVRDKMYDLAKVYYDYHGNLEIPVDFKTKDGYTSNKNGFPLGAWLVGEIEKIICGKLSKDKLLKLEELCPDEAAFLGNFDQMCNLASRYYAIYRHLDVPIDFKTKNGYEYDKDGLCLGAWIWVLLDIYNNGKLDEDKKHKLENNGMIFDDSEEYWNEMYRIAFDYYRKNGNLLVSPYYVTEDGHKLGVWLYRQKYLIGIGKLDEYRVDKLKNIGVVLGFRSGLDENDFDLMCELTEKHYKHFGDLSRAKNERYTTLDGINPSDDGYNLGLWIILQENRLIAENLSDETYKKLVDVGIDSERFVRLMNSLCNSLIDDWDWMYSFAVDYYNRFGNLDFPDNFKTVDGSNVAVYAYIVGKWKSQQIKDYHEGKLGKERALKLMNLGMKFTIEDVLWEKSYNMAKIYDEHHGILNINLSFKTINGYEYDENGYELGDWVKEQIRLLECDKLNDYKVEKLKLIGIDIDKIDEKRFELMYQKAKKFYLEHGHLDALYRYRHDHEYNETNEEMELHFWTLLCRRACKNGEFDDDRQKMLENIGLFLPLNQAKWNNMYNLASNYYKHHGNLDVPDGFKTYDGYTYDAKGFDLGKWINYQRTKFSNRTLSDDKIYKLNIIGMYWEIRTSVQENRDVCLQYGIDYKSNLNIIKHISNVELISKINYLIQKGECISKDGILHEIFSMSSIVMKNKYGLTLEELINEFYIFRNRRRIL